MFARHESTPVRQKISRGMFSKLETRSPCRVAESDKENCSALVNQQYGSRKTLVKTPVKSGSIKPSLNRVAHKADIGPKSVEPNLGLVAAPIAKAEKIKVDGKIEELTVLLDRERKIVSEYKKMINSERAINHNLKAKVKHLELEKEKGEENHKRSLAAIEQRVAQLKNTNMQLLSKAGKFEAFSRQLADVKEYKESVNEELR